MVSELIERVVPAVPRGVNGCPFPAVKGAGLGSWGGVGKADLFRFAEPFDASPSGRIPGTRKMVLDLECLPCDFEDHQVDGLTCPQGDEFPNNSIRCHIGSIWFISPVRAGWSPADWLTVMGPLPSARCSRCLRLVALVEIWFISSVRSAAAMEPAFPDFDANELQRRSANLRTSRIVPAG